MSDSACPKSPASRLLQEGVDYRRGQRPRLQFLPVKESRAGARDALEHEDARLQPTFGQYRLRDQLQLLAVAPEPAPSDGNFMRLGDLILRDDITQVTARVAAEPV